MSGARHHALVLRREQRQPWRRINTSKLWNFRHPPPEAFTHVHPFPQRHQGGRLEFGDRDADEEARAILGRLYPGREIVTLNVDPVGEAGGCIHCATQQQPRV